MKHFILWIGLAVACPAWALPKLSDLNQMQDIEGIASIKSRLLRDHQDEHLLYITPAYIDIALDRSTQEPLFKLSLSQLRGDGELTAVLQVAYDTPSIAADWFQAKTSDPRRSLKKLPIYAGRFGIELETPEFALMIGRSESVLSDLENGLIPLSIALHPEGVELLRALNSIPNQSLMFLNFSYRSNFFVDTDPLSVTILLADLLPNIGQDRFIKEAWDKGMIPSREAVEAFFVRKAQVYWFMLGANPTDIRVVARLLLAQLQNELGQTLARPIDLADRIDVDFLKTKLADTTLQGSMQMGLIGPGENRILENSVAMAFKRVCEKYADRVYIEETGESQCFDFQVLGQDNSDDSIWNPF